VPIKKIFKIVSLLIILTFVLIVNCFSTPRSSIKNTRRPNILLVVSDDQSYPHASAYGYKAVKTPGFDRIAKEGVLFTNAYSASPGCSPSRAALLTGRNDWQLEEAGTHAIAVFPLNT